MRPPGFKVIRLKLDQKKIIAFCAGFLACAALIAGAILSGFGGWDAVRAAWKYASVLRIIQTDYVADYDIGEITDAALAGAISGLDDRWSYYMDAEEYAAYKDYSANRYQGIGVTITKDEESGGFIILAVTKDGPAQTAGIIPGDMILAVDGQDVTEAEMADLRSLIQSDFGQSAIITVRHEDGSVEDFPVSCEEVYSPPVEEALLADDVGYIVISNFREGAGALAVEAVDTLTEQGAQYLVFDVRSNPGGQVSEMTEILDRLLPEGDIFIRADKNGNEMVETSDETCVELPMAVIVNTDSYSAAEYFAAALKEYGAAALVGEPTTGKARSQVTVALRDGSAVHLSKYTYLTPQRNDLFAAGGLQPDVEITLTEEQRQQFDTGWLEPEDDPQVKAAISELTA